MITDAAVVRHMQVVRDLSRPGQPLAGDGATATVNNPAWFGVLGGRRQVTPARDALHAGMLLRPWQGGGVRRERRAVVMAGPPGAGKTTIRRPFLASRGEQEAGYLVVDADYFKDQLVAAALADGSFESWIKPARVRELEADGERFFPLEMSALLQRESSLLAMAQRRLAVEAGANIVLDGVLWDAGGAVALGRELVEAGYSVSVLDVEVPYEVSLRRIERRWEAAYRDALAGGSSAGGRWVPSEYVRTVFAGPRGVHGPSLCQGAARALAEQCPAVVRYQVYRLRAEQSALPHSAPVLEVDLAREAPGGALVDAGGLEAVRVARVGAPVSPGRAADGLGSLDLGQAPGSQHPRSGQGPSRPGGPQR